MARANALRSAGRMHEGAAAHLGRSDRRKFAAQHPERLLAAALPVDMRDKSVCVIGEQGIGDQIFFLRYAPGLKSRDCRVTFHGNGKIASILSRSQALDQVLPHSQSLVGADFTLLVGDLPHLVGGALESSPLPRVRGVPAQVELRNDSTFPWHCRAYWPELPPPLPLEPLTDRMSAVRQRLLLLGPPPYLGLTWRAGTGPEQQRGHEWLLFKEIPLPDLAAALAGVPATLVSLQRSPHAGETDKLAALVGRPVHDLSAANEDLEEVLAILAALDEYVGVSNTNMHLRASVGRTARVVVPWPAEWRWLIAGTESPWFPGFRIYRQRADGDWGAALERLAGDLRGGFRRE